MCIRDRHIPATVLLMPVPPPFPPPILFFFPLFSEKIGIAYGLNPPPFFLPPHFPPFFRLLEGAGDAIDTEKNDTCSSREIIKYSEPTKSRKLRNLYDLDLAIKGGRTPDEVRDSGSERKVIVNAPIRFLFCDFIGMCGTWGAE
eukprot:437419-Amorphochlora_amoeboformis.AAC.1